jgi:hypothetical protein
MAENWSLLYTGRDILYPVIVIEDPVEAQRYADSLNEAVRRTSVQVHPDSEEDAKEFSREHEIKVRLLPAVRSSESIPSFGELRRLREAAQ